MKWAEARALQAEKKVVEGCELDASSREMLRRAEERALQAETKLIDLEWRSEVRITELERRAADDLQLIQNEQVRMCL